MLYSYGDNVVSERPREDAAEERRGTGRQSTRCLCLCLCPWTWLRLTSGLCPSVCLSLHLSSLSIYPSICMFSCPYVHLFVSVVLAVPTFMSCLSLCVSCLPCVSVCLFVYLCVSVCISVECQSVNLVVHGVATISGLLQIVGLFCRI